MTATKLTRAEYLKKKYYERAEKKKTICKTATQNGKNCGNCKNKNLSTKSSLYCKKHSFNVSFSIVCNFFAEKTKQKPLAETAKNLLKKSKTDYLNNLRAICNE